jgi:hypothetical protein
MRRLVEWFESIDPLVIPIAIDAMIALLAAWLIMGTAEFLASLIFFNG